MSRKPRAFVVFALIGTALLLIAVVLGLLGSFAFIAIAAVGCFFIAAALVARASRSPTQGAAAVISVAGLALVVFGLVATPLFVLGWARLATGFMGMTPWGQIVLVALITVGGALLVARLTGRPGYGWSYAMLVLALASAALGVIATIAFVWAAILALIGIAVLVSTLRTLRT